MPLRESSNTPELPALLWVFATATISQLAKMLSSKERQSPLRVVSGAVGAGIAGVAVSGILLETQIVSLTFLISVASVVGWIGGNLMASLAVIVERRLGIEPGSTRATKDPKEEV